MSPPQPRDEVTIRFGESAEARAFAPLRLPMTARLSEELDVQNSPVLFGCRTGICGTCLVLVEGEVAPADEEEREVVEAYAPEAPQARLACQLRLRGDVRLSRLPRR